MVSALAENWWLEKGQYCDQDAHLYPKGVIMDAYKAGFEVGMTHGKHTKAVLTNAMHSDGLYRCPTCDDSILKPGHCHNPHCPDRRQ